MRSTPAWLAAALLATAMATTACSGDVGKGAAIGAAGVDALGPGSILGNAAAGAVAGAAGGYIYDQEKDKKDNCISTLGAAELTPKRFCFRGPAENLLLPPT